MSLKGTMGPVVYYCGGRPAETAPRTKNEHYPKLVKSLKDMRRKAFLVACGNNCTIILTGPFQPPPLLELCLEAVMKEDPKNISARTFDF